MNTIDLQQSDEFDEVQLQNFLNPRKSKSDDLFLKELIIKKSQMDMRQSLIFNPSKNSENGPSSQRISIFKSKPKKEKQPKLCDYRKNICGYITKKIIRQFAGNTFQQIVQQLCDKYNCNYSDCRSFYLSHIQHVTGPAHVSNLLLLTNLKERKLKMIFREFFNWFLKQRYIRYLMLQGKMADKNAYIQYKNLFLLPLISQNEKQAQKILKQEQQMQALKIALKKNKSKSKSKSKK